MSQSVLLYQHTIAVCVVVVLLQRWYIDGTVKCFNGGHAPLGILAILVLGLCVAIIPLSLVYITATVHVRTNVAFISLRDIFSFVFVASVGVQTFV